MSLNKPQLRVPFDVRDERRSAGRFDERRFVGINSWWESIDTSIYFFPEIDPVFDQCCGVFTLPMPPSWGRSPGTTPSLYCTFIHYWIGDADGPIAHQWCVQCRKVYQVKGEWP